VATKIDVSTGNICPQQGVYARQSNWVDAAKNSQAPESEGSVGFVNKLRGFLKSL
jgi:hypothetical protein